jgi:hypothetical protein
LRWARDDFTITARAKRRIEAAVDVVAGEHEIQGGVLADSEVENPG